MTELKQQSEVHSILHEIDRDFLLEYNRQIAKEIRLSGSEEELRAFHYIKEQLEDFGLTTELTFDKAYISIPVSAELKVGGISFAAITHSMSAQAEQLSTLLRFIELKDSDQTDWANQVTGQAVVVHGLANGPTIYRLQQLGAVAVIFINSGAYTHEMIVSSVWGNPTPEDDGYPSIPVLSVNHSDGEQIKSLIAAEERENVEITLTAEVRTDWVNIPTLIAEIKGTEEPESFVLFSGHVDSWHYGAMDNGSANAVIVETARVLSLHRNTLRRSVRFAFWSGHSHGRYAGSALYSDLHWEDLHENGVLHINIDSVGAKGASQLGAANTMAETRTLCANAIRTVTDEPFRGSPFGRSGDQSFWGAGLPSAFMGLSYQPEGWFGWWWHTTEDTLDKIDGDYLARDCKVYAAAVHNAASSPIIPLDQRQAIRTLSERVGYYTELIGDKLDLSRLTSRIQQLQNATDHFYDRIGSTSLPDASVTEANRTILSLSRWLVPINYVRGSRYDHDAAGSHSLVPALSDIELLATAEVGSEAFFRLQTSLIRQVNRIGYEIKRAVRLVVEAEKNLVLN
ncbi:M28 family peptidase [Paenibacillus taichungensis]|uniref:M28 family metallopeptidase n=1 Tax=Paenibacillus taichungensis TaxID=484184 RepID=UPI002DB60A1D|nr:M28 family metallopeptidase [Paenibacillus taichungensis]MEC0105967.1 M28 family peptidase [Paenibacillus taichungensis]MEC0196656.1 M28 family peptidase [Paenibacillus taichungensis]